jgi:hypothetical protein
MRDAGTTSYRANRGDDVHVAFLFGDALFDFFDGLRVRETESPTREPYRGEERNTGFLVEAGRGHHIERGRNEVDLHKTEGNKVHERSQALTG